MSGARMPLFNASGKLGAHEHAEDEPDFTAMIDMTFILLHVDDLRAPAAERTADREAVLV